MARRQGLSQQCIAGQAMLLGHIAVSVLLHRYLKAELVPTVAGGMFPDLMDKTLCQLLRLTPSGRMYGHTLVGWAVSTATVRLLRGPVAARSWAVGFLGHLVADLGGPVPWAFPFLQYEFPGPEPGLIETIRCALSNPVGLGMESILLAWALGPRLLCRPRQRENSSGPQPVEAHRGGDRD